MKELVLQPSFYKDFECIGGKCINSCCHYKWSIDFTKEEFKNVKRKIHTEEFRKIFDDAFVYHKETGNFLIKFDEDNNCKFLDEDGLCNMYKEVGHENMNLVCKIFPRHGLHYMKEYEYYLSPACEEVVRILTEEKNGIKLEYVERELTGAEKQTAEFFTAATADVRPILYYYNDFKKLLFGVLQNRDYDFGERMVVLGIALKKIDEMEKNGQADDLPQYIESFITDFNNEKNKDIYNKLFEKVNRNGQKRAIQVLSYFFNIDDKKLQEKVIEKIDYKATIDFREENAGEKIFKPEKDMEFHTKKYAEAMAEFKEFLKGKEYWIENVMLEGFLYSRMPFFMIKKDIWSNYMAMAMIYSIFLFYLTCLLEKDSTKEDFMDYVSKIARWTFHNGPFMEKMEGRLEQTESNTLAHMAVLVL